MIDIRQVPPLTPLKPARRIEPHRDAVEEEPAPDTDSDPKRKKKSESDDDSPTIDTYA